MNVPVIRLAFAGRLFLDLYERNWSAAALTLIVLWLLHACAAVWEITYARAEKNAIRGQATGPRAV